MSIHVDDLKIIDYDAGVKAVYQSKGFLLRNTMRTKMVPKGYLARFQKQSKGMAQQKATQDAVIPMNLDYDPVNVTLERWHAAEYSDIYDQADINFNEMQEIAKAAGMAIGRRSDQIAITALVNSGTANTIAAGGTAFNYAKWLTMNAFFSSYGIGPSDERYVVVNAEGEKDILEDDKFIDRDYANMMIGDGTINGKKLKGYNWIVIPDMDEGGVPAGYAFAWAKDALGFAINLDLKTTVSYENNYTSMLATTVYYAGAGAIDNTGIVQIAYA